jgi:ribosomal protein S18 acetylase RimI-like enzyme
MNSLRHATAADVPALHALIERAYRGDAARAGWTHEADLLSGPRTDAATLAAIVADPASTVLLNGDGGLRASITVTDRGGIAYLGMLAVDPALQATGLGRTMLAAAEAHARAHGATAVEMTVVDRRPELIAYYERRGYVRTGEVRPFPAELTEDRPLALIVLAKPV